ncbi:MAG: NAD-dependent epimerase/dehydratase family protein [Candidatus Brocadiales bacterium]|nr:NAD-dependent epimerase/dehydratase family protein [Candidatus Brocadiales bacterium]
MINSALVTGGNSFIGIHLVNELIRRNVNIVVYVRSIKTIPGEWIGKVKVIEGDLIDNNSILNIGDKFDVVFHLAAYVHKTPKTDDEKEYVYAVNVEGTKNLLDFIPKSIKHIVFFSSVSVYGNEVGTNLDEITSTNPTTLYGKTKLSAEQLVIDYGNKYKIKTTILRLPLVYGPGNKGNIYNMIKAIDNRRFVMMGRGLNKRSMVYVGNVVNAAMEVLNKEMSDGKVYLITDGIDYTVRDLYRLISKGLGRNPLPFYVPMGIARMLAIAGDIGNKIVTKSLPFNSEILGKLTDSLTFSSGRIQEDIGLKPKYNLYNTIDETIRWYKTVRRRSASSRQSD